MFSHSYNQQPWSDYQSCTGTSIASIIPMCHLQGGAVSIMSKDLVAKSAPHRLEFRQRSKRLVSCNDGFSLIEVMISLVILAIGVLALTELQLTVTKGNSSSSTMATALSLAEQKMESLKKASYTTIQAESPTPVTTSDGTYSRQVIVTKNQPK